MCSEKNGRLGKSKQATINGLELPALGVSLQPTIDTILISHSNVDIVHCVLLSYFINVHGGEGHKGVDHGGGDVLLHNGHDQVEAHHHLHRPPDQEHRPDPRGPREVQLVTKSRGQPEIVYVTSETNFRQI